MYLAMGHVHQKLLKVICMIQQQFSSNENKKLMLSANALCSEKFRHIEHNTIHTLFQFITCARLTLDDTTKSRSVFIAQTALMHHLLSKIRIAEIDNC